MLHFEVVSPLPSSLHFSDLLYLARALRYGVKLPPLCAVSLSFVSEPRMQVINQTQRRKDHPTDVLSFATAEDVRRVTPRRMPVELGEIFLCPTYARREAKRRGIDEREELLRLIIHGVLHLQGYDHVSEYEEAEMFARQERILERVLTRPKTHQLP